MTTSEMLPDVISGLLLIIAGSFVLVFAWQIRKLLKLTSDNHRVHHNASLLLLLPLVHTPAVLYFILTIYRSLSSEGGELSTVANKIRWSGVGYVVGNVLDYVFPAGAGLIILPCFLVLLIMVERAGDMLGERMVAAGCDEQVS